MKIHCMHSQGINKNTALSLKRVIYSGLINKYTIVLKMKQVIGNLC